MNINHPFLFIIRNKNLLFGNDILFISKVENLNGEEEAGAEGRDNTIKEYDIQTLEIPANDFLCNIHNFWHSPDSLFV